MDIFDGTRNAPINVDQNQSYFTRVHRNESIVIQWNENDANQKRTILSIINRMQSFPRFATKTFDIGLRS